MTSPAPLEILGRDSATYAVSFRRGGDETTATTVELATARLRAIRYGHAYVGGLAVDEADLDLLIKADTRDDLPLWPVEYCTHCETQACVVIEGRPHCGGHANGYRLAEESA